MKIIPFEKLYNIDFIITEPMAKKQYWYRHGKFYSCIGKPKPSHTFLWLKNCSAVITDKDGKSIEAKRNSLAYMSKGLEYKVKFLTDDRCDEDTAVIHFQLSDRDGDDICPSPIPLIAIKNVDIEFASLIDRMSDEYSNSVVCIPEIKASIYKILTAICKNQKKKSARDMYASIKEGIKLLEANSDLPIKEIAEICGISECYFRKQFKEYSGESPMDFRQRYRIEKAKQLLLSDEGLSVGEIAEELKFSDIYHFSKTFKKYTGCSPLAFSKIK